MPMQTLAYLLPVLTKAIQNAEEEFLRLQQQGKAHEAGTLQALVIVPSRELAMQIVRVAQGLLPHEARATIQQCIGGANPNRQVSCNLHMTYSCTQQLCRLLLWLSLRTLSCHGLACLHREVYLNGIVKGCWKGVYAQAHPDRIRHVLLGASWPHGRQCFLLYNCNLQPAPVTC